MFKHDRNRTTDLWSLKKLTNIGNKVDKNQNKPKNKIAFLVCINNIASFKTKLMCLM